MECDAPLKGIKVVEIASFVMTPASGGILAAYGADVVKIEPSGGADAMRKLNPNASPLQPGFELANNRKRAMHLDIRTEEGHEVVMQMLAEADIFLTNMRGPALVRANLVPEELVKQFPRLIVAHGTGYGQVGPRAFRPAFDELAYWARGGIATAVQREGEIPISLKGALGDLPSAVALAAGMLLALFRREREGRGSIVDVSLYGCGIWANGSAILGQLAGEAPRPKFARDAAPSPLYTSYQCADERWVQFAMNPPMKYWPLVCDAFGRADLMERFATFEELTGSSPAVIVELEAMIKTMTRDELGDLLDSRDLPWAPIFEASEVAADEQARANKYIRTKMHRSGVALDTLTPPFQLRDFDVLLEPAPAYGEHTEEVLLELGYDWEGITGLRDRGVFE